MNYVQSEAALENSVVQTLQDLSYEKVLIADETALLENFKKQITLHNLEKHLKNIPLTNSDFERLLISLGGKGVFNSSYNLRQLQPLTRDDGSRTYIELLNQNEWCKNRFQVTNQITEKLTLSNIYYQYEESNHISGCFFNENN